MYHVFTFLIGFSSFPLRAVCFFLDLPEAGSLFTGCPFPASTQRGSCRKTAQGKCSFPCPGGSGIVTAVGKAPGV